MDSELSSRAGLNIGIEPTLLPFVQAGADGLVEVNPAGDTVVAEHTDQAARVPFGAAAIPTGLPVGYVWNTGAALPLTGVNFFFKDELGNEILVAGAGPLATPGPLPIGYLPSKPNEGSFFCLAPGEQIVARLVTIVP